MHSWCDKRTFKRMEMLEGLYLCNLYVCTTGCFWSSLDARNPLQEVETKGCARISAVCADVQKSQNLCSKSQDKEPQKSRKSQGSLADYCC